MADPTFLSPGNGDALQETILNKALIENIVGPIGSAAPLPFDTYFTKRLAYAKIPSGITIVSSGVTSPDAVGATSLWSGTFTPSVIGSVIRVRAASWLSTGAWDTNAVHLAILRDGVKVDHRVGMGVDSLDVTEEYATTSLNPITYKITSLAGGGNAAAKAYFTTVIVEELIPAASPSTTKAQLLALLADSIGDVMPKGSIAQFVGQYPTGYTAVKLSSTLPTVTTGKQRPPTFSLTCSTTTSNAPFRIGCPYFVLLGNVVLCVPSMFAYDTIKCAVNLRATGGTLSICSAIAVGQDHLVIGTTNAGAKVYRYSTNSWVNNITINTGLIQYGFPAVALSGSSVLYISGTGNEVTETDLVTGASLTPVPTPDASTIYALWKRRDGKILVVHGTTTSLRGSIYDPTLRSMTQIGTSRTLSAAHSTTGLAFIEAEDRILHVVANSSHIYEWTDSAGWIGYPVTNGNRDFSRGIQQGVAMRMSGCETLVGLHLASSAMFIGFSRVDSESAYTTYSVSWAAATTGDVTPMSVIAQQQAYPGQMTLTYGNYSISERNVLGTGSAITPVTRSLVFQSIYSLGWMRDLAIIPREGGLSTLVNTATSTDMGSVEGLPALSFNNTNLLPSTGYAKMRATTLRLSDDICVVAPALCWDGMATLATQTAYAMVVASHNMRNYVTFFAMKD